MRYLISHRCLNNHNYKENSIKGALDVLNKDYIDGIEVDIRITKDNKIIIYHNFLYKFKIVSKLNYNELEDVDLFENLVKSINTSKIILLDIKCEDNNYINLINNLLAIINKYPNNYYLCSFNYDLINYLKDKTNYNIGIFITDIINRYKSFEHLSFVAPNKNVYNYIKYNKKFVWTINSKKNINNYEYIITDKAYLLK